VVQFWITAAPRQGAGAAGGPLQRKRMCASYLCLHVRMPPPGCPLLHLLQHAPQHRLGSAPCTNPRHVAPRLQRRCTGCGSRPRQFRRSQTGENSAAAGACTACSDAHHSRGPAVAGYGSALLICVSTSHACAVEVVPWHGVEHSHDRRPQKSSQAGARARGVWWTRWSIRLMSRR
jgi:hypothetical protein